MKVCILGKSKRNDALFKLCNENSFITDYYTKYEDIPTYLEHDIILFPIPTLTADKKLNIYGSENLNIIDLLNRICSNSIIVTCNYEHPGKNIIDINKRDDFAYLNSVPTAEGAIKIAIEESKKSLLYSNILIVGFGRVAKILSNRLNAFSSNLTIAARSSRDRAIAEALGYNSVNINNLKEKISNYDIIFQTVPVEVINTNLIDKMRYDTFIIELSSGSKGTDFKYAEKYNIKIIHAPALPEKVAPETAGKILYDVLLAIYSEQKKSETQGDYIE